MTDIFEAAEAAAPDPVEEPVHIITLDGNLRGDEPPRVACTCDWATERSENLLKLGTQAVAHSRRTGHELRQHNRITPNGVTDGES